MRLALLLPVAVVAPEFIHGGAAPLIVGTLIFFALCAWRRV
jgi:K+ transporter